MLQHHIINVRLYSVISYGSYRISNIIHIVILLNLVRVGAELKFTRGRHVMTGVVKWIGQRPQGSNKTFIGVEAAEDVMDPGKYLQKFLIFEKF